MTPDFLDYDRGTPPDRFPISRYWIGAPMVGLLYGAVVFVLAIRAIENVNPDAPVMSQNQIMLLSCGWGAVRFPLCYLAECRPLHPILASFGIAPDGLPVFILNGIVWGISVIGIWHAVFQLRRKSKGQFGPARNPND